MKRQEGGENCIMRNFVVLFSKYNQNNQIKKDEMGGACSTNGGEEECI
jgi:hypothetical protein